MAPKVERTARIDHTCHKCGETIHAGEKYIDINQNKLYYTGHIRWHIGKCPLPVLYGTY